MHVRRAIDRYLADGLGPWGEARMRRHLARCEPCRAYYDEQLLLHRALAGDPAAPTSAELERMAGRALRAAGVSASSPARGRPGWRDALLWFPAPAAAAALVLVLGAGGLLFAFAPEAPAGRVVRAEGLRVEGAARGAGFELRRGDRLEVGKEGLAELELARGGQVRVFPGARLSLGERGERVELEQGKVWCEVDPKPAPFEVRTAEARARVLGTSFVVERASPGATEVRVAHGAVEVKDAGGRGRVRLTGGQKSRVVAGKAPSPPERYSPDEDLSAWRSLLDHLRRIGRWIGRGLQQGIDVIEKVVTKP